MICKWVIKSILFSGMLPVLTQVLTTIKPNAIINSTEYGGILLPGEIIGGWHQAAVNHYMFKKTQLLGYDHPDDRYLSLKLFWPKKILPNIGVGRIIFFKCINRTPATAKALMHIIRGGIGTSELVLEIIYAPVKRTLINTLIITCDIYTESSDLGENEDIFLLKLFQTHTPDTARKEEVSVLSTTARKTTDMINTPSVISVTTIRSQEKLEEIEWKSRRPVERNEGKGLFDSERSPGISVTKFYTETASQRMDGTIAYTKPTTSTMDIETTLAGFKIDEKHLRVNSPVPEGKNTRRISSSEEPGWESGKPVLQSQNMNIKTEERIKPEDGYKKSFADGISPMTSRMIFADELSSGTMDQATDNYEVTTLNINLQTIPLSRETSLETTTTGLWTNAESLQDGEDSKDESMNIVNQSEKTRQKFEDSIQQSEETGTTNYETQMTYSNLNVRRPHTEISWNSEFNSREPDMKTLHLETTTLKIDQTILPDDQTTMAGNTNGSKTNRLILKTPCSCSENEASSNGEKKSMKLTETILDVKNAKDSEASSLNSQGSPGVDVVTQEERENDNPSGKERTERPVTSPWYNLVVNALPQSSRRKMGLAKITYG